jgi:hypothetical protein
MNECDGISVDVMKIQDIIFLFYSSNICSHYNEKVKWRMSRNQNIQVRRCCVRIPVSQLLFVLVCSWSCSVSPGMSGHSRFLSPLSNTSPTFYLMYITSQWIECHVSDYGGSNNISKIWKIIFSEDVNWPVVRLFLLSGDIYVMTMWLVSPKR